MQRFLNNQTLNAHWILQQSSHGKRVFYIKLLWIRRKIGVPKSHQPRTGAGLRAHDLFYLVLLNVLFPIMSSEDKREWKTWQREEQWKGKGQRGKRKKMGRGGKEEEKEEVILGSLWCEWVKVAQSCLTLCDPLVYIGMDSLSLLQGISPTRGWNPGLPHCRQIPYQLSHKG